jgi:gluconokinase
MRSKLILSVDVGTSAVKAVLFDLKLNQIGISRKSYPLMTPRSGWSEQDPGTILINVREAITKVLNILRDDKSLVGIVFSCQMYGVFAVNPQGNPITPILSWADNRSSEVAQKIRFESNSQSIYQVTGCPIEGIYPLSKIKWMIENGYTTPDSRYISIKDYIIFHLTGQFITDWSMASSTGMMDIRQHRWDSDILAMIGINTGNLSELASPWHLMHLGHSDFLDQTGILPGTPLVIGAGDAPLSSLGVGAFNSEVVVVNVGTSTAARKIVTEPLTDPKQRLWTYAFDETYWVTGGMSSSGGMVYEWFLNQFKTGNRVEDHEVHKEFENLAYLTKPGADGLLFIPYLLGEQSPAWQPKTRGSFLGLDINHNRGHFTRAVLEGITFSIYRIIETIQLVHTTPIKEIRVTGGLASSPLWQQIASDIFGATLLITESTEGSARGGAIMAWQVLGYLNSIQDIDMDSLTKAHIQPREEIHEFYMEQYQKYLAYVDCINKAWPN